VEWGVWAVRLMRHFVTLGQMRIFRGAVSEFAKCNINIIEQQIDMLVHKLYHLTGN
jgi:hypothetical protein